MKQYDVRNVVKHNTFRRLHQDTGCVVFNAALTRSAQAWANEIKRPGRFAHSPWGGGYGENLYVSGHNGKDDSDDWKSKIVAKAVTSWYSEIEYYNFTTHRTTDSKEQVGHFTQVVWNATTQVGIGVAVTRRKIYVVGHYKVAGNFNMRNFGESRKAGHLRNWAANVLPLVTGCERK